MAREKYDEDTLCRGRDFEKSVPIDVGGDGTYSFSSRRPAQRDVQEVSPNLESTVVDRPSGIVPVRLEVAGKVKYVARTAGFLRPRGNVGQQGEKLEGLVTGEEALEEFFFPEGAGGEQTVVDVPVSQSSEKEPGSMFLRYSLRRILSWGRK